MNVAILPFCKFCIFILLDFLVKESFNNSQNSLIHKIL